MNTSTMLLPERTTGDGATAPQPHASSVPVSVWRPWIGRSWIATTAEEAEFVRDLATSSGGVLAEHTRSDVTACLNALRSGLTVTEALEIAPGLRPERLLSAYTALERARAEAERSWRAIVDAADIDALIEHGQTAAALLPSPIGRLAVTVRSAPEGFARMVARVAANVEAAGRDAHHVERALADCRPPSDRGTELGNLLYNPYCDAIANRDDYLAERVGMLTPPRVAALLGEQRSDALDALGVKAA